jgi:hypothetical protein
VPGLHDARDVHPRVRTVGPRWGWNRGRSGFGDFPRYLPSSAADLFDADADTDRDPEARRLRRSLQGVQRANAGHAASSRSPTGSVWRRARGSHEPREVGGPG